MVVQSFLSLQKPKKKRANSIVNGWQPKKRGPLTQPEREGKPARVECAGPKQEPAFHT